MSQSLSNITLALKLSDGSGNLITSTGNALDVNIKTSALTNQSMNVAQLAGTTTDTNSGSKSAGTLRVVIATDQPALTNKLLVTPDANSAVNVSQMNGVTVSMGSGIMGTGVQRVAIASDNDAISVKQATGTNLHAVLDANSGVDIGKLTANQSVNNAQVNGVTLSTGSGIMGTGVQRVAIASDNDAITVKQATGTNLHAVLDANSGVDIGKLTANQSVNVAQVNGVTTLMGNGVTGTGSQRVTIASDNTAFAVNATLQANSGVDIGKLTANQSVNVAQMNGVSTSMGSGVMGTGVQRVAIASDNDPLIVKQATAANLNAQVVGDVASGSSDSGNPVKQGAVAHTAAPTAVTDGQRVNLIADKVGKQIVAGSIRDLKGRQTTTITASTSETTIVTAVASTFLDVYRIVIANTSATACQVTIKDSTGGTTVDIIEVPANATAGWSGPESAAANQTTVNNNWTATCGTSVSSIIVTAYFVKNI